MIRKPTSPYIAHANRLADVIAAIQVLGVYPYHMRKFNDWADAIVGDVTKGEHWKSVFEDHPEFFRLDTSRQWASLVWRRQYPKRFHVGLGKRLSHEERDALDQKQREELTRDPLSANEIKTLIDTAINLHSRAVELQREGRWWITLVVSAGAGLIGVIIGALVKR